VHIFLSCRNAPLIVSEFVHDIYLQKKHPVWNAFFAIIHSLIIY